MKRFINWLRGHRHHYVEMYGDLREDEPGGPRTLHEIYWECSCGKQLTKGCAPEFLAQLRAAKP